MDKLNPRVSNVTCAILELFTLARVSVPEGIEACEWIAKNAREKQNERENRQSIGFVASNRVH